MFLIYICNNSQFRFSLWELVFLGLNIFSPESPVDLFTEEFWTI